MNNEAIEPAGVSRSAEPDRSDTVDAFDAAEKAETDAKAETARQQERVLLHMPIDVRSLSLAIVATLAAIYAVHWAKEILVPLLLGVMFSYALTPAVDKLQQWRIPRALGAGVLLSAIVALISWGAWSLSDDASSLVEILPQVAQKVRQGLEGQRRKQNGSTIDKVQQAANELEQAAAPVASLPASEPASAATTVSTTETPSRPGRTGRTGTKISATTSSAGPTPIATTPPHVVTRVVVEHPAFNIRDYLWSGTLGAFAFLGQLVIVFFVTLFLLASGDTFRRKMVKLAGPRLSQKRITIQALDEVSAHIQRYMLVQLATSVVLGVVTGLVFFAFGLHNAPVWGVVAAVTNLVPYVGAVVLGASSALVAFIQFDSLDHALLIGGSSFAIHALVGNLLTPWLTGRASRMSPFAVFVGVLAFGWLWGPVGLILGTPILMVVKTVCDRVDELKPVGEFLGA
ncbi:MAG: AI-2E family transporter [Caldimonas sp.]